MADFYLDNDVTISLAPELRSRGHDARTTRDLGLQSATDGRQLLHATQNGWIFVTHNRKHFVVLHEAWMEWTGAWQVPERHAGIIVLPHGIPARDMAREIDQFLHRAHPFANHLYEWTPHGGWRQH